MNTLTIIAASIFMILPKQVDTGKMIGLQDDSYGPANINGLFEIEIPTGWQHLIAEYTHEPDAGALALAPDGTLFANFAEADNLVIVDPETGVLTNVGQFENVHGITGLAFSPAGLLYGFAVGEEVLLLIDPISVDYDVVATVDLNIGDLAFGPDGLLYALSQCSLYILDVETGDALEVGSLDTNGYGFGQCYAMAFVGDVLYASAYDTNSEPPSSFFLQVDVDTGAGAILGTFNANGTSNMEGMAFVPGAGDADRDGDVDGDDFDFFVGCFGSLDDPDKSPYCAFLDSDDDGDIDCDDWEEFIPNWTEDTEPPTLPICDNCEDPPCTCDGDANLDGVVDPLDSGYVLARLGCSVGTGDDDCDAADVNGDGVVDPLDSGYVLARFGTCE